MEIQMLNILNCELFLLDLASTFLQRKAFVNTLTIMSLISWWTRKFSQRPRHSFIYSIKDNFTKYLRH